MSATVQQCKWSIPIIRGKIEEPWHTFDQHQERFRPAIRPTYRTAEMPPRSKGDSFSHCRFLRWVGPNFWNGGFRVTPKHTQKRCGETMVTRLPPCKVTWKTQIMFSGAEKHHFGTSFFHVYLTKVETLPRNYGRNKGTSTFHWDHRRGCLIWTGNEIDSH